MNQMKIFFPLIGPNKGAVQKFKVQNIEIQKIITQYKKYGNPNQLLAGNKIDIIVAKSISEKKKYYSKI